MNRCELCTNYHPKQEMVISDMSTTLDYCKDGGYHVLTETQIAYAEVLGCLGYQPKLIAAIASIFKNITPKTKKK
jgi:hypothetical protein